ncbi:hypothetical protein F7725_016533, partial [Dissostichus mawsoni]
MDVLQKLLSALHHHLQDNASGERHERSPVCINQPQQVALTMRIHCKVVVIAVCFGVFLLLYFLGGNAADDPLKPRNIVGRPLTKRKRAEDVMHLAVVACGNRLDETLTMVKSALLFSLKRIMFHIFAEDPLAPQFEKRLNQWPHSISSKFQYRIYPITFSVGNADEWKKLFKPCAAQRLFLPVILKDVDSLLYVDTDVLPFNSTQLAAMAPEHEVPKIGWYSRFARHPFYGVTGVNSGVMLMNLTRIRSTLFKNSMIPSGLSWEDILHPLYQKYKNHITWGDQDLLNIIFHYNPECLFIFPCQWNYRPDHCMYGSNCKGAEKEGVSILHGNRGVYHDDKQPAFKVVYDAICDFPFEDNMFQSLFYPIQTKFLDTVNTLCGRIPQVFLKQIEKTMRKAFDEKVVRH